MQPFFKPVSGILLSLLLLSGACKLGTKETEQADPAAGKSWQQNSDGIRLSPEQIQLGNIRLDTIRSTSMGNETVLTGAVNFDQSALNALSSRVAGRIEKLYYKNIGDPISKGARLYDLYSEELNTAQQEYLLILEKQKTLGNSIVNYNDLAQSAKSRLLLWGMSAAQLTELAKTGKTGGTTAFYSTVGGTITELDVKEGDYVAEGATLLKTSNLSRLWVEAQVYTSQLSGFNSSGAVSIQFPDLPGKTVLGKISFVNPEIDPDNRINLVRIEISNTDNLLKPGMPAYVRVKDVQRKMLSLPSDAVLRNGKMSVIWIETARNSFKSRMVQTGEEVNGFIEIRSGLQPGDVVVTSGAYLLQSESIFRNGAN